MNRNSEICKTIKYKYILTMGTYQERREEKIFAKIMANNLLYLLRNNNLHIQETQQIPRRTNGKIITNRNIMVNTLKVKGREKILKTTRGK